MKFHACQLLSPTHKRIFQFELDANGIYYTGAYNSHRDHENDVWGEDYRQAHQAQIEAEQAQVPEPACPAATEEEPELGQMGYDPEIAYQQALDAIEQRYQPARCKTLHGKTRYSGSYWGRQSRTTFEPPTPCTLSETEIRQALARTLARLPVQRYTP